MLQYVLALGLVTMVFGEGCCPPDAWEGVATTLVGAVYPRMSNLPKVITTLHLNGTLGMIAMEEDIFMDGQESKIKTILDYNNEIGYTISNGSCTKEVLKSMMPRCIQENATLVQDTYFGAGSEKVAVKTYKFKITNIQTYLTVTASGCVPIVWVASLPFPSKPLPGVGMEVMQFSGITTGVKDPSVFDIPPICQSQDISIRYVPILSRLRQSVFYQQD